MKQNIVNNKPNSFLDIPDLSLELYSRPVTVLKYASSTSFIGSVNETVLFSGTIPKERFSETSIIELYLLLATYLNANNKTIKIKLGGKEVVNVSIPNRIGVSIERVIFNRNSKTIQDTVPLSHLGSGNSFTLNTVVLDINTNIDVLVEVTSQTAVATDGIILRHFFARVTY